jgi:hypothetical protein
MFDAGSAVPYYFFHVKDAQGWIKDEEGLDLPTPELAIIEARTTARDFALTEIRAGKPVNGRTTVVVDDEGKQIHEVAIRDVIRDIGN